MIKRETVTITAKPGTSGVSLTNKPQPKAPEKPVEQAPPADAPKPTDAEIEQRRHEVAVSMGWEKPKPAEPKQEAPPKPAEEAPKPTSEQAPAEAKPAEPKPGDDAEAREERLISRTAKETAHAVAEAMKPKPDPEPKLKAPELNAEDQEIHRVLEFMEKSDPKAKGQAAAFYKFAQDRYAYQTKWEKENKGKEFDPDAPEHEEFFKQQPDVDEDAFEQARTDMRIEARVQERLDAELGPIREKEAHAEQSEIVKKAMPVVVEQVSKQVLRLVESLDAKLAVHLKNEKGEIVLTKDHADKLAEADPIAAEVLEPMVMDELAPIMLELEKTAIPGLKYQLNPAQNAIHARIASYVAEYERDVMSGPASVRTRTDGAEFITVAGKSKLQAEANEIGDKTKREAAMARIEKDYFTLTIDELEDYILDDISARAQKKYERLDGGAKKKYANAAAKNGAVTPPEQPAVELQPAPVIAQPAARRRPPTVESQTDVVNVTGATAGGEKKFGEVMVETAFGK